MPDSYSQIKYTDFRVELLAMNDPLLLQQTINAQSADNEAHDTQQEMKEERAISVALWVLYFKRDDRRRPCALNRVIINDGERFKDIVLRDMVPRLRAIQSSSDALNG